MSAPQPLLKAEYKVIVDTKAKTLGFSSVRNLCMSWCEWFVWRDVVDCRCSLVTALVPGELITLNLVAAGTVVCAALWPLAEPFFHNQIVTLWKVLQQEGLIAWLAALVILQVLTAAIEERVENCSAELFLQ